jgi:signal transduction histidine kinase
MRDLTQWVHLRLRGGGAPERSIDDDGAQLLDSELGSARMPLTSGANTERVLAIHPFGEQNADPPPRKVGRSAGSFGPIRLVGHLVRDLARHDSSTFAMRSRMEELAAANRRKDEFLAMLAHELRDPLTAIRYGIRVLSGRQGDAPTRERMQALVDRQLHRMTQLVDELLDVSRITGGRLRLHRERLDLRLIVSRAIETLEPDIKERTHHLSAVMPDAPVWLHGDPFRLEQVFVNLLANALRYTDPGGDIAVWVQRKEGEAVVRIRDSGIGIAPEVLPHVFALFKQGSTSDPRSRAGLGVGLAVVESLVHLHGGRVAAASGGSGQGSEFTVHLAVEACPGGG